MNQKDDTVYIPLLNIPLDKFRLRTEVTHALGQYEIREQLLTFRDQISLTALQEQKKLHLTLVDFHVLPSKDSYLESAVREIIDHRKLDRQLAKRCSTYCRISKWFLLCNNVLVDYCILVHMPIVIGLALKSKLVLIMTLH